jgi:hypothetical protein
LQEEVKVDRHAPKTHAQVKQFHNYKSKSIGEGHWRSGFHQVPVIEDRSCVSLLKFTFCPLDYAITKN